MSSRTTKQTKIEEVLKPGATLKEGNYDALLSDDVLKNLKEWDRKEGSKKAGGSEKKVKANKPN